MASRHPGRPLHVPHSLRRRRPASPRRAVGGHFRRSADRGQCDERLQSIGITGPGRHGNPPRRALPVMQPRQAYAPDREVLSEREFSARTVVSGRPLRRLREAHAIDCFGAAPPVAGVGSPIDRHTGVDVHAGLVAPVVPARCSADWRCQCQHEPRESTVPSNVHCIVPMNRFPSPSLPEAPRPRPAPPSFRPRRLRGCDARPTNRGADPVTRGPFGRIRPACRVAARAAP